MGYRWYFYASGGPIFGRGRFGHKSFMSQSDPPSFHLRLTPPLQKQVKLAAVENDRSMNAEILARLERSFSNGDADRDAALKLLADAMDILDKGQRNKRR